MLANSRKSKPGKHFRMSFAKSDLWNEFKKYKLTKIKDVQMKIGEHYYWR